MSVSTGPLTAPLASMRGATAAGSMTRMRYVRRVPGPCSVASVRMMLVNNDGATRFLEGSASPRPAPALLRDPPAEQSHAERDDDPEHECAGADGGARHDESVGIAGRPRQGDAHLQLGGARRRNARTSSDALPARRARPA